MSKNNHHNGPVVRPYAEGFSTLQVAFSVYTLDVTPYEV